MHKKLPTPRDIQHWRPTRLGDFVACDDAKAAFVEHLIAEGDGANTLLEGETGSAKTSIVEAYIRTRNCPHAVAPLDGPCGTCDDCRQFDFERGDYGLYAACRQKVLAFGGARTHFYHLTCLGLGEPDIEQLVVEIEGNGSDRSIVYLDEIQELANGRRDRFLLKPLSELNAVWIATGITANGLSSMFVRRFGRRCQTTLPKSEELAVFLVERCREWEIQFDADTIGDLVDRSGQIVAECLNVLAVAASRRERALDKNVVMGHPFIMGSTPTTSVY